MSRRPTVGPYYLVGADYYEMTPISRDDFKEMVVDKDLADMVGLPAFYVPGSPPLIWPAPDPNIDIRIFA